MSQQLSIGREAGNDIVISHPYLSERHAVLSVVDAANRVFHIRDLGSTNGTYKNGKRIEQADFTLDDTIELAGTVLKPEMFLSRFLDETGKAGKPAGSKQSAIPVRVSGGLPMRTGLLVMGASLVVVAVAAVMLNGGFDGFVALQILSLWLLLVLALRLTQTVIRNQNLLAAEKQYRDILFEQWRERAEQELARHRRRAEQEQDGWNGYRKFEIARRVVENRQGDIVSFYLVPHDKKALPQFRPGQYLTFRLRIPGQEREVIRCYSLSDRWHENYYRISIKRMLPPPAQPDAPPGLSSNYFHDRLQAGAIVDVKAPSGKFYLNEDSEAGVVLIAGGVGITPMLSMLNTLCHQRSTRDIWFFYGVRNGRELAMRKHLKALDQRFDNLHMHWCFSDPLEEEEQGKDYHHAERVSVDLFRRLLPSNNFEFYMCGPPPMMSSIAEGLEAWGVPDKDVYFEAFGPASVKKKKADIPAQSTQVDGALPQVEFSRSGKTIPWDGKSESLLELAEANGIELPFGCRAGNCGTCQVAVRSGEVSYISEHDVDIEQGSCLACIAQPVGNLVLDA